MSSNTDSTDTVGTTNVKSHELVKAGINIWSAILLALVVSVLLCQIRSKEFEKNWEVVGFFPSLEEDRWLYAKIIQETGEWEIWRDWTGLCQLSI